MHWDQLLGILLMVGLTGFVWKVNRHYEQSGTIFAVPFNISRARTPRLFRGSMIFGWLGFALMVAFSILVSAAIIASWL